MTSTSRKYDLVVFDWDGTVMDTTGLIAEGIRQAAAALGCRVPDRKTASSVIGLDWRSAMAIAVPDCPAERLDEFNEAYKAGTFRTSATCASSKGSKTSCAAFMRTV